LGALQRHYSDRYAETPPDLLTRNRFRDTQRTLETGKHVADDAAKLKLPSRDARTA
jgi:hypothetical protein